MPRIVGVDIPNEKVTWVALQYVHGIGKATALKLCAALGLDPARRARDLTDEELARLAAEIERSVAVEGNLRRQVQQNVARLKEINCYRGDAPSARPPGAGATDADERPDPKGPRKTVAGKKSVKQLR